MVVLLVIFCGACPLTLSCLRERTKKYDNFSSLCHELNGLPGSIDPTKDIKDQVEHVAYNKKREVDRSSFIIGTRLGSGNFGDVHKGEIIGLYSTASSTNIAIKSVRGSSNNNDLMDLICEIKIMSYVKPHLNLVSMIGVCSTKINRGKLWLLIELCEHGDLKSYLRANKTKLLSGTDNEEANSRFYFNLNGHMTLTNGMLCLNE